MDVLFLSRLQFAVTIGFHFIFPPISIGLAWLLVVLEWRGWRGNDQLSKQIAHFFARILALTFAVGVATGIVMEFQFGTNWAEYSRYVGDIFGAPLAAEAVIAFFLESTFLGLYLFGRKRVSKGVHWFSILMVAVGATLSAFWIIVANSWQQTPAGFVVQNGRAELTNFAAAIFNASTFDRFFHTMVSTIVAGAFLMIGVSAYRLLKNKQEHASARSLQLGMIVAFIFSILSLYPTGHSSAAKVAQTQPEKFATMEGLIHTETNAGLTLFGIPSSDPLELKAAIKFPGLLSWLAHGDSDMPVEGMTELQQAGWETPPYGLVFTSFHIMIMLGMLFILLSFVGVVLLWRKLLLDQNWYLKLMIWMIPLPLIAIQFGWIVAEVGRQPWVVYRLLKTADAYSTNLAAGEVLFSLVMFSLIYLLLGGLYLFLLLREIKAGPKPIQIKEA
jgi:cytochrome bd ubiquinol oxidase subunit I